MRISNLLLLILLSCSRSGTDREMQADQLATFTVDPVAAVGEEAATTSNFNIASSRILNFTACVKDVARLEAAVGAEFSIKKNGEPVAQKTTDGKGCLYWSETFSFEGAEAESYLEIERTIEAEKVHKGKQTIRLAVNPWKKGSEAVRDLRFQAAPAKPTTMSSADSGLIVDSVLTELEVAKSDHSVAEAHFQFSFKPKMKRLGTDGSNQITPLTDGSFLVKIQLFGNTGNGTVALTKVVEATANLNLDNSQGRANLQILRKIPRESVIEVLMEIIPINAPQALKPIRGRYTLGRLNSLALNRNAIFRPEKNDFATEKLEPLADNFGFELGRVKVEDVVVTGMDGTGRPRTLEAKFIACLKNSVTLEKIPEQAFGIKFRQHRQTVKTDAEEGCLHWSEPLEFDFHSAEKFQKLELTIKSANAFYGEQSVSRIIHINPWKYDEPIKFVLDENFEGPPAKGLDGIAGGSEIITNSIFFNFIGRTFEVDSNLNLSTIRKYRFEMQPKIRRMSRNGGWLNPLGSGNGRYRLHFLMETVDDHSPQIIDQTSIDVESRADTITSTVDFKIGDIRLVNARTSLTVKIEPLDASSSLKSVAYYGAFEMGGGFAIRMEPRPGDIFAKVLGHHKTEPKAQTSLELFKKVKRYHDVDLASLKLSPEEFSTYFASGNKSKLQKLCALFFDEKGWYFSSYRYCLSKPEDYLNLVTTHHVRKILASKMAKLPENSTLSISHSLSIASTESNDETSSTSQSLTIDAGAKLSAPLLESIGLEVGVGMGVNKSWGTSKSFSKGKNKAESKAIDLGKQIIVDEAEFDLSAELDRCLVIGNKYDPKDKKVFLYCDPKPLAKTFKETYYLVYQPTYAGPLIDSGANVADRPFFAMIRGKQRFQTFVKVLQDPNVTLNFNPNPSPEAVMREAQKRYDGFFPGLLTSFE